MVTQLDETARASGRMRREARAPSSSVCLGSLPSDLLGAIATHCGALTLLSLAGASHALRTAAEDVTLWATLLRQRHRLVLAHLFDGEPPEPRPGLTQKQHYFEFSASWKAMAMERTPGRLLLTLASSETAIRHDECKRTFGGKCPGSNAPPHAHAHGRGTRAIRLKPACVPAVFDVTQYALRHPGGELLLMEAAEERDATATFHATSH